jgi:hypothetical protein
MVDRGSWIRGSWIEERSEILEEVLAKPLGASGPVG